MKEALVKIGYEILFFFHFLYCRLFCLFPIDRHKIHVSCWNGRGGFSCNPKYIISELEKEYPGQYKIYWAVNSVEASKKDFPPYIRLVRTHSIASMYHQMTAFLWIDNCRKDYAYRRRGQNYLQTWHGAGAMKKVEADAPETLPMGYEWNARKDSKAMTGFISASRIETEIFSRAFWYNGPVLELGAPRTDILFSSAGGVRRSFCNSYGLPDTTRFVLYAPTFRDNSSGSGFDFGMEPNQVLSALADRFGGQWRFLVRMHKHNSASTERLRENAMCIDVTAYPDMQELMAIADVAIDDYSSWVYEYMHTGRPCFMYAPDVSEYDGLRGLYIDYFSLPFPVSETMEKLCRDIREYDEAATREKVEAFGMFIGSVNDGRSSERVVSWIRQL